MHAIALIPFATPLEDENAAHLGRGLALELSDWLNRHDFETLVLTTAQTEEDGEWRKLVSFMDELTPELAAEFASGTREDAHTGDASGREFDAVISGILTPLHNNSMDRGFRLTCTVTDVRGAFALLRHEVELTPSDFGTGAAATFRVVMDALDRKSEDDYDPGTTDLHAWQNILITRALTMAAQVGAISRDAKGLFAPALEAALLDNSCTIIRDRLAELCHALVIERGFEPQPAIKALETVMSKVGADWKSHHVRGELMLAVNEPALAARSFCHLLEGPYQAPEEETRSRAALNAGRAFNLARRPLEAQRVLGIAMQDEGQRVAAIVESANSSAALGEGVVAERLWQRALELQPMSVAARYRLARHYRARGDLDAAREQYLELVKIPGLSREAFADTVEFFVTGGHRQEALQAAERYAEEHPGDAIAHVLLAGALNLEGRHKRALKELERAEVCMGADHLEAEIARQRRHAAHPESEQQLRELGMLATEGDPVSAEAGLAELLQRWPDFWEAHMFRAVALRRLERYDDALKVLLHLRENRELPGIDKELTAVYSRLDRPAETLEAAERAMKAQPEDARLMVNYAAALLENDRVDDALTYARRAEQLLPGDERIEKLMDLIRHRMRKRGLLKNLAALGREMTSWFKRKPPPDLDSHGR
jgi:tetratricopeptide (TPR) repeat protein